MIAICMSSVHMDVDASMQSQLTNDNDREVTRSQTTAMLHVAAMTPTLPRNSTNAPTLLIAITRRTLLVRTPNACQ